MDSLKEIFRIGKGPSSSHTMGPSHAAEIFARRNPNAKAFEVTLYGSLAATGKGHLTDVAINEVLSKIAPVEITVLVVARSRKEREKTTCSIQRRSMNCLP